MLRPNSIVCNTTSNNDAHKQQPAPKPPSCSPDYYHGSISGWGGKQSQARRKSTVRPLPHGGRGFLFIPNGTKQVSHARFVPLAKGRTYAGSLEKVAGTAIGAAKTHSRAGAGANTKAQRTIEPGTREIGDRGGGRRAGEPGTGESKNKQHQSPISRTICNLQFAIHNSQSPAAGQRGQCRSITDVNA